MKQNQSLIVSLAVTVTLALVLLGATLGGRWSPKLGLDLAGGSEAVYKPAHPISSGEMNTTIDIIRNRIDGAGVAGALVGSQGGDLVAQFPGIKDPQRILNLIGQTAQLQFRPVLCDADPYVPQKGITSKTPLPTACSSSQYDQSAQNLNVSTSSGQPQNAVSPDPVLSHYPTSSGAYNDSHPNSTVLVPASAGSGAAGRYLLGKTGLLGQAVTSAQATFASPSWVVDINLSPSGLVAWNRLAQQQFHAYIAMDLDGQVVHGAAGDFARELFVVFDVLFALALFDAVERRLRDEDALAQNQLIHVPEEEREQQRTDV